jgi:cyclic pyranopterin monophosphate synthase
MKKLTHTDEKGKAVMVDIGEKPVQKRIAIATGQITLKPETVRLIGENQMKKGDVLTVAQIAAINAAKQTGILIPLCHNITLDKVDVKMRLLGDGVSATAEIHCTGRTGVEMEALTAVSTALLTVYDMCKAVDKTMVISVIRLTEKIKK